MEFEAGESAEAAAVAPVAGDGRERSEVGVQFGALGPRIRARRALLRVTLDALAQRTGLSKSYLSRIENGKKTPPLDTLARIARALGTDINLLLGGDDEAVVGGGRYISVVRAADGSPAPRLRSARGYAYQCLTSGDVRLRMQPYLIHLPPEFSALAASEHDGQEFMHVLRGRIEWDVGGETFVIGPGDSVYLDSRIPHRARALDGAAEALVVVTPWQVRGGDGDG